MKKSPGGNVVGLFAGIGGLELGLDRAGWRNELLCEIADEARWVLAERFQRSLSEIHGDIRKLRKIPKVEIVAGGFPCQDLSQAGMTKGIRGSKSGLVDQVFRLVDRSPPPCKWLLLENVPFMLQLDSGKAVRFLTRKLRKAGFSWAYRVVNTRAFGLPQRRRRVILLASKVMSPELIRGTLFNQSIEPPTDSDWEGHAVGFYWTEGVRGLGWAVDHVPTLKCGSTISIASPPAIWLPEGIGKHRFIKPTIEVAERLQGFERGWTLPATSDPEDPGRRVRASVRWRLVGNAVSVPVAEWIGKRLKKPEEYETGRYEEWDLGSGDRWPNAAYGEGKTVRGVGVTEWPCRKPGPGLLDLLQEEGDLDKCPPLSARATAGFYKRFSSSSLRAGGAREALLESLEEHAKRLAQGSTLPLFS